MGEVVRFSVTDTGIGIAEQDQERVFHEFQQVDGAASRHYEGTGLGLALTRRFAELQGSDEGEHSARTEFSQSLDKEVVVNRSREKTLTGFEVRTVHDREIAEGHVGYGDIKGFVAEPLMSRSRRTGRTK